MEKVDKIKSETVFRLAQRHGVEADDIIIFIGNKNNKIEYIYSVKKLFHKDENGNLVKLNFAKDVLGKKFDAFGVGMLVGSRVKDFFQKESSNNQDLKQEDLCIYIKSIDKDAKHLGTALFSNYSKLIRKITLDEVIGF